MNSATLFVVVFLRQENNKQRFFICCFENYWRRIALLSVLMVVNCIPTRQRFEHMDASQLSFAFRHCYRGTCNILEIPNAVGCQFRSSGMFGEAVAALKFSRKPSLFRFHRRTPVSEQPSKIGGMRVRTSFYFINFCFLFFANPLSKSLAVPMDHQYLGRMCVKEGYTYYVELYLSNYLCMSSSVDRSLFGYSMLKVLKNPNK